MRDDDFMALGTAICLDVNGGHGPDVKTWACHAPGSSTFSHQQFKVRCARTSFLTGTGSLLDSLSQGTQPSVSR